MKNSSGMCDIVLRGRVIKCESHRYLVDFGSFVAFCKARKKIKSSVEIQDIMVGDFVNVDKDAADYIIYSVEPRKNSLIRPLVSNIDQVIITIAPIPVIDYLLLDKLIINCQKQNLDIILCLNKSDIAAKEDIAFLERQYKTVADKIITVSALNKDIKNLLPLLSGKLTCFAGQSAVGKSSIINILLRAETQQIGELSEKNSKGKNTTTSAYIFKINTNNIFGANSSLQNGITTENLADSAYIIDTPGFTMLDIHNIDYADLDLYYPEYLELGRKCKYHRCTHTSEPFCEVKKAVELGNLSSERYERYKILFSELKEIKKYEPKRY